MTIANGSGWPTNPGGKRGGQQSEAGNQRRPQNWPKPQERRFARRLRMSFYKTSNIDCPVIDFRDAEDKTYQEEVTEQGKPHKDRPSQETGSTEEGSLW